MQYSRYDKKEERYDNQQIWLSNQGELEQLHEVLNEFFNRASDEEAPIAIARDE